MSDEYVDLFADEVFSTEGTRPSMILALRAWNLRQPAWAPFKRWEALTIEQKLDVCVISINLEQKETEEHEALDLACSNSKLLASLRLSAAACRRNPTN